MKNKIVEILYKRRVFFGFIFGVFFIFTSKPTSLLALIIGLLVALAGESIRLIASGFIIKTDELSTDGPYSIVRHPLYFGSFVMGLGLCISIFSVHHIVAAIIFLIAYLVLFFGVYIPVLKKEEQVMTEKYGQQYLDYMAKVPMLFPNLSKCKCGCNCSCKSTSVEKDGDIKTKKFDKAVFMENREYRALLGLIAIMIVLLVKYSFISIYGS